MEAAPSLAAMWLHLASASVMLQQANSGSWEGEEARARARSSRPGCWLQAGLVGDCKLGTSDQASVA